MMLSRKPTFLLDNRHFDGFILTPSSFIDQNVSFIWFTWSLNDLEQINTLSKYGAKQRISGIWYSCLHKTLEKILGSFLVQIVHQSIHTAPMMFWIQWRVMNLREVAAVGRPSLDQEHWRIDCLSNCLAYLGCLVVGDGLFGFYNLLLDNHGRVRVIHPSCVPQQLVMSSLTVMRISRHC